MEKKHTYIFFGFVAFIFALNLFIGSQIELSFDEAYYWVYSEHLAWGYYDHPPMVALFIRLGTFVFGNTELAVRFFFNIFSCLSLLLLFYTNKERDYINFILLFLSFPLLTFAGILALPDGALVFFATSYFFILKKYIDKDSYLNTLLLALTITGMFYSKYHGLLIVILTVLAYPKFLKQKSFWACAGVVTILYLPHMYWQYMNDFVTFKFHLTGRGEKHFEVANVMSFVGGQIVLMGLTLVPFFIIYRKPSCDKDIFSRILYYNSFGFLIFLFCLSFRNQIEANWSSTCGLALILLYTANKKLRKNIFILTVLPVLLGFIAHFAIVMSEWGASSPRLKENRFHEISFWKSERIPLIGKICGKRQIVTNTYQIAAKVSFYLNRTVPALHLSGRKSHYSLLKYEEKIKKDKTICYLSNTPIQKSVRIDTGYHGPLYIVPKISLNEILMQVE